MKKIIFLAALIVCTLSLNAQESSNSILVKDCKGYNRISLGYMGSSYKYSVGGYNLGSMEEAGLPDGIKGVDFGYTRGVSLSKRLPFFLEIGGQINYGTNKLEGYEDEDSYYTDLYETRHHSLAVSLPISLTYKLSFQNGMYIAPYAGMHFDVGILLMDKVSGLETVHYGYGYDDYSDTYSYYSEEDMAGDDGEEGMNTFNRFQLGWQVGVNIGYKRFNLGLAYKSCITPMYKEENIFLKTTIKNHGPLVTLGINF